MSDLIFREELIRRLCHGCLGIQEKWCEGPNGEHVCTMVGMVKAVPAAVTLCKNCQAWERCQVGKRLGENGFCSAGKAKEEHDAQTDEG